MKKIIIFFAIYFSLCMFIQTVGAQANDDYHYVRKGTGFTENCGEDWSSACDEIPVVLERGYTYYIADGDYQSYIFDDLELEEEWIYIKKASVEDHGTDLGWDIAYGDGVTIFSAPLVFETNNWSFDGVSGGGPGSWDSRFGFKVITDDCQSDSKILRIDNGADNILVSHVDMGHCGVNNSNYKQDIVYTNEGSANLHFSYNYLHDVNRVMLLANNVQNLVFEYNYFARRDTLYNDPHGEAVSINHCGLNANNTFRYNYFQDISGTGFIVPHDSIQSHFYIYGNIFDSGMSQNGVIANSSGDTNTHMYVYNNVFYNISGFNAGVYWDNGSDNYVYNNIWHSCKSNAINFTGLTHDYNSYYLNYRTDREPHILLDENVASKEENSEIFSSSPFVDYLKRDFRLQYPSAGIALEAPYNIDILGNSRAIDGIWDRGVYEYRLEEVEDIVRADVDQSGSIDFYDAKSILQKSLGFSVSLWHSSSTTGDVNCDGTVSVGDALLVFKKILSIDMDDTAWCNY